MTTGTEDPRTAEVDALFAPYDKPDSPGCALAILQEGRTLYERGYGMAILEYAIPITPETIFHVASISKQFTSFCIYLLAQEGKLSLEDEVRKHLPELPDYGKSITLRHLVLHTSGLRDHWDLVRLAGWRMEDVITEDDLLSLIWKQRDLNFAPGAEYLYSNTGHTLLGVIVRRITGQSLREFADAHIFRPLGMDHTHFHNDHQEIVPNRAYSYYPKGEGYAHSVLSFSNMGATSLFTTVRDLAKWDENFTTGQVGGKALLEEMQQKGRLNDNTEITYAGGLAITPYRGEMTVGHNGADAGFRSTIIRFPGPRFSVIILANTANFDPATLAKRVADIYLADRLAQEPETPASQEQPPAEPLPPSSPLDEYAGDYYSEELGVFYSVLLREETLIARHKKGECALEPLSADSFRHAEFGKFHFQRNRRGRITGFMVDTGRIRAMPFRRSRVIPAR
ncbi:MAG TPA: serine hydrolase domain-containing protein [Chthonomonadaceae bacterium]|nr:serine hydrolase domain-containing protein [Chthonomonadaceae bacterium]